MDRFNGANFALMFNMTVICIVDNARNARVTPMRKVLHDWKSLLTTACHIWEPCKITSGAFVAITWNISPFIVLITEMHRKSVTVQLLMRRKLRFLGKLFPAPKRSLVWSTLSMQNQRGKFNYKYGQVCFRNVVIYLILRVKHVEIDYELVRQPLQQRIACQNKKRNRNINIGIVYLKVWWIYKFACRGQGSQLRWRNDKNVGYWVPLFPNNSGQTLKLASMLSALICINCILDRTLILKHAQNYHARFIESLARWCGRSERTRMEVSFLLGSWT